jgi:mannose-6-phosphate isomerase class I
LNSNYDKFPSVQVKGHSTACWEGWHSIVQQIATAVKTKPNARIVVETYPGVRDAEIRTAIQEGLQSSAFFVAEHAYLTENQIDALTFPDVTDDRIFGYMTRLRMEQYFDREKMQAMQDLIQQTQGIVIVYGTGAALLAPNPDLLIYADMARWEIQLRMRRNEVGNLGANNHTLEFSRKYKRAYFVDWRIADRLKRQLMPHWDYVLDTNTADQPKMATGKAVRDGMQQAVQQPFRVVPLFDPGPWGGQWMKEVCDLDRSAVNYAWCFDCVPEENSLLLDFGPICMEIPSINVVFYQPIALLGENVYARFGAEFPIRFDFLDTMEGGNLSLQVHPLTEYIREHFGMFYTQDESYYMLDTKEDACVYLGLKTDTNPAELVTDLEVAQTGGAMFDAEKHVEKWLVKKHDHILIPAGTIHCSGKNSMVLEISATPYIFTFKLWDWGRLGLDGLPRPINIGHGKENIVWNRTTDWVAENLVNQVEKIAEGDGWEEERTGLHATEFIETRRFWFSKTTRHDTQSNLQVLNLVEGREVIVESPNDAFPPFHVHYAETFIVPASVGAYLIRPIGESLGQTCGVLKAYVRS